MNAILYWFYDSIAPWCIAIIIVFMLWEILTSRKG